jgi:hypothetical protein
MQKLELILKKSIHVITEGQFIKFHDLIKAICQLVGGFRQFVGLCRKR